jgi:hypothetical protein
MHIFLERIVRLELQVVLFHLIFNQKKFTLAWLNHQLNTFAYDNDQKWLNFLRLVQITLISTSPIGDESIAGMLCQLIITHHTEFVRLYPKSNVTPKMHYCIHLVRQMQNFVLLHNHK